MGRRGFFFAGAVPLLLVLWLAARIPESDSAHEGGAPPASVRAALQPLRDLVTLHPDRTFAIFGFTAVAYLGGGADMFVSKHAQDVLDYTTADVSRLLFFAGWLTPFGAIAAGFMSDRIGRVRLLVASWMLWAVATLVLFRGPSAGLGVAFALSMVGERMTQTLLPILIVEVVPASYRATAAGAQAVIAGLAVSVGLWAMGFLTPFAGDVSTAVSWVVVVAAFAPVLLLLGVPDRHGRPLPEAEGTKV